jgi:hypothetical protein
MVFLKRIQSLRLTRMRCCGAVAGESSADRAAELQKKRKKKTEGL